MCLHAYPQYTIDLCYNRAMSHVDAKPLGVSEAVAASRLDQARANLKASHAMEIVGLVSQLLPGSQTGEFQGQNGKSSYSMPGVYLATQESINQEGKRVKKQLVVQADFFPSKDPEEVIHIYHWDMVDGAGTRSRIKDDLQVDFEGLPEIIFMYVRDNIVNPEDKHAFLRRAQDLQGNK